jgi:hypothetical protein
LHRKHLKCFADCGRFVQNRDEHIGEVFGVRPANGPSQQNDGIGLVSGAASDFFKSRMRTDTTLGHLQRSAPTRHQDAAELRAGLCNSEATTRALAAFPAPETNFAEEPTEGAKTFEGAKVPGVIQQDEGGAKALEGLEREALEGMERQLQNSSGQVSALELGQNNDTTGRGIKAKVGHLRYDEDDRNNIITMTFQGGHLGEIVANKASICLCDDGTFLNIGHHPLKVVEILRNNIKVKNLQEDFMLPGVTPDKLVYVLKLEKYGDAEFRIKITDKFIGHKGKDGAIKVDVAMVQLLKHGHGEHIIPGYVNVAGGLQVFIGDFPVGCLREIAAEDQPGGGLTIHRDISPFLPAVTEVILADQKGHARPFQMLNVPQDEGIQLANELVKVLEVSSNVTISRCAWDFQ